MSGEARYVPAAGRAAFTRLYDPVLAVTMRERRFRGLLLTQVLRDLPQNGSVVDVGSGTGTFASALATARPDGSVIAVDGDPDILLTARNKPGADRVVWREGRADRLPLDDASSDAVVMSLLLHHLDAPGKRAALAEAHRLLRPGAHLHIADWGQPADPVMKAAFFGLRLLDGFDNTREHAQGRVPELVRKAGFDNAATRARMRTAWGSLELISARK